MYVHVAGNKSYFTDMIERASLEKEGSAYTNELQNSSVRRKKHVRSTKGALWNMYTMQE